MSGANISWRQPEGDSLTVEIEIPFPRSACITSSQIKVVAELQTLTITVRSTVLWQAKLYYPVVEHDVTWNLSDASLCVTLIKKEPKSWAGLILSPLGLDDSFFLSTKVLSDRLSLDMPPLKVEMTSADPASEEDPLIARIDAPRKGQHGSCFHLPPTLVFDAEDECDSVFVQELQHIFDIINKYEGPVLPDRPTLPPMVEDARAPAAQAKEPAINDIKAEHDMNLDELLDAATDEFLGEESTADSSDARYTNKSNNRDNLPVMNVPNLMDLEDARQRRISELEVAEIEKSEQELLKRIGDAERECQEKTSGSEEHTRAKKTLELTQKMLKLQKQYKAMRARPTTIGRFLAMIKIDLLKSKLNIGDTSLEETEEYSDLSEEAMSCEDLIARGLEESVTDPRRGVHFLRLAACNHKSGSAAALLYSMFAGTPMSAKGAQLLLAVALDDGDESLGEQGSRMLANERVADLFNGGSAFMPPTWALAVYFYQRAARYGSVHAISNLASLNISGQCGGADETSADLRQRLLNSNMDIANYFVQKGLERGCVASMMIRATQFALGSGGCPQNLAKSHILLTRAMTAQPALEKMKDSKIAGMITLRRLGELVGTEPSEELREIEPSSKTIEGDIDSDDEVKSVHLEAPEDESEDLLFGDALTQQTGNSLEIEDRRSAPVAIARKKATGPVAGGVHQKKFWERAAKVAVGGYAIYCIAFPIRVILLSHFYRFVARCMELVGMAEPGTSSMYVL